MKRANNLIEKVAEPENLRLAAWKAAKGKRHTLEVLQWSEHFEENIFSLRNQILSGQVIVGNYRYFKVFEPKERQICASAFGEQVLHHALMNICHDYFEHAQIFDSYASRKGKGVHVAIERAKKYTAHYDWYLKLDVRKFFDSIHHTVLLDQLSNLFKDKALIHIFELIIRSYQANEQRGLPIGNLTSQYFANHYLSGLDEWIKVELKVKAYTRYMDDMVFWHSDQAELKKILVKVDHFLETKLRCSLKPIAMNRTKSGLPFLGYHVFPHHIRLLQKSKQRFIAKIRKVDAAYHSGDWTEAKCQRKALPLIAFIDHAGAHVFKKNVFSQL